MAVSSDGQRISVSVVGARGQAARHIRILEDNPGATLSRVFYHRPPLREHASLPMTARFADCFGSDVIIVSSPTPHHARHLEELREYPGYVLIEKPAAARPVDIDALLRLPADLKSRTRVNFNFWFHPLAIKLRDLASSPALGRVFAFDVHVSHGGAFRDDWSTSWRLENGTQFGPLETVGVHFIQFVEHVFGSCNEARIETKCLSNSDSAIDTGTLSTETEQGVSVRIRCSYAAPYAVHMSLWGTNGYLSYDGETATLQSPRDSFDDRGFYRSPPVLERWNIDYTAAWRDSLAEAQADWLNIARQGRQLDPQVFDRDASVMNVLLAAD